MARDEKAILATFRKELEEDGLIHEGDSMGTDDGTLLRFLRARKFKIPEAKVMVENCQAWRSSVEGVGIDKLYRRIDPYDYPERAEAFKYWPLYFHQTDKEGRPLNIQSFGSIDINKLYKVVSPERHWQTVVVNADSLVREVLPAASRRAGKPVDQVFVIVDLKGFSLGQFWQMKTPTQKSFAMSQDYFPETLGKLAIVNAPSSFTMIWGVIRPWLSKETVDKVEILGSNYKEHLLKLIDADMLPASLGGNCNCPGGCDLTNPGPWMDDRKERREMWLRGELARPSDPLPANPPAKEGNGDAGPHNADVLDNGPETESPTALEDQSSPLTDNKSAPYVDPRDKQEVEGDELVDEIDIERDENPLPGMSRVGVSV